MGRRRNGNRPYSKSKVFFILNKSTPNVWLKFVIMNLTIKYDVYIVISTRNETPLLSTVVNYIILRRYNNNYIIRLSYCNIVWHSHNNITYRHGTQLHIIILCNVSLCTSVDRLVVYTHIKQTKMLIKTVLLKLTINFYRLSLYPLGFKTVSNFVKI